MWFLYKNKTIMKRNTFLSTIVVVALLALLSACGGNSSKNSKVEKAKSKKKVVDVPRFNSDSAYKYVAEQCAFGPRVPGSEAANLCADYLENTLERFADTVYVQEFKARAYNDKILDGKNIIASFGKEKKSRVFLSAHWDSRPYADHDPDVANHNVPIDGANDGASGVGVLLEMARLFAEKSPSIGVDIVLFDVEDYGPPQDNQRKDGADFWGLGSQYWAKNPHVFGYNAYFGILLDMVGDANARFPMEEISLYYAPHVVKKVWATAERLGYGNYFVKDNAGAITDDHYYVNTIAGIPTIDIIHIEDATKGGSFVSYWHTINDNIDNIDKNTLGVVGETVTQVVYEE